MKLLLNDKEIAHFLNKHISVTHFLKEIPFETRFMSSFLTEWVEKREGKKKKKPLTDEEKKSFKEKLQKSIRMDLRAYLDIVNARLTTITDENFHKIHKNIDYFINRLGEKNVFNLYRKSHYKNFIKGTGLTIDPNGEFIRRKDFHSFTEDCLIRNTVGNEELLVTKIDKSYPFWFIDSGYTNFLEPSKKWHRLVRNHLHYGNFFDAPADRLGNFKEFPMKWRKDGEIILIIEPGPFAAGIFHVDLKTWKYDVEKELRKYTDKPIQFREKAPLRQRTKLFDELKNEDYYCVVNINSNAATEAIWAGVPAITLDKHITNPVTRNKLSDINSLFYGNIAPWLAFLSYTQFTKEELFDGTAYKILREYNV